MPLRRGIRLVVCASALALYSGVVLAHGGGGGNVQPERLTVPTWLFILTGGSVIGASFLLTSFVTDRALIQFLHTRRVSLPAPRSVLRRGGRLVGLGGLLVVLLAGFVGPTEALQNVSLLLLWVGWWAGYTMTVYLVGNSWPAINPFRTVAAPLGSAQLTYPEWLRGWPSVVALLALIWIEIVSPLNGNPRLLAVMVSLYLGITLVGSFLWGTETWFTKVDPVSSVFRQYGKVAPIQRQNGTLSLTPLGSALIRQPADDLSEVGLVVALVWGTTYDGFVQTPLWAAIATPLVEAGMPARLLYLVVLIAGYGIFTGGYWIATRSVRHLAPTYLASTAIARLFAPPLLAIAAGYHLAHYLSYVLTLSPALGMAIVSPLRPTTPVTLTLPGWFGGLSIAFVLLGHLLAIWVAHSVAHEQFPSKLQAIRSQYPITLVMVLYTMLSLWIVTQPSTTAPYL